MSLLNSLLDTCVAAQNAGVFSVLGNTPTAAKRKLPKREEQVDGSYLTAVSGAEKVNRVRRIAFGARYRVQYVVEITLITPADRDTLQSVPDVDTWLEGTRALYMSANPLASLTQVKQVDIDDSTLLDRAKLAQGYDYNQVVLLVTTYEAR